MKDFERLYNRLMESNGEFNFSIASSRLNRFINLFFLCLTYVDFEIIKECGYDIIDVSPSDIDDYPVNMVLS